MLEEPGKKVFGMGSRPGARSGCGSSRRTSAELEEVLT